MTLPSELKKSPLREAIVEIRFESNLPSEAIFGTVYGKLRGSYPQVENLPILQVPEKIRSLDKNLVHQAHHKLRNDRFVVLSGPKMFALSFTPVYSNWHDFLEEISVVFDNLNSAEFITSVNRLGLRYVNAFDSLIFTHLDAELSIMGKKMVDNDVYLKTVFGEDDFQVLLQLVSSPENVEGLESADITAHSVIDTDVSLTAENIEFFGHETELLNRAHAIQKKVFFGLLKPDFLESLGPVY